MENTLRVDDNRFEYIFDLKGSTVDRKVKGKTKNTTTLKDINFIMVSRTNPDFTKLSIRDKKKILEAIKKDVQFLKE